MTMLTKAAALVAAAVLVTGCGSQTADEYESVTGFDITFRSLSQDQKLAVATLMLMWGHSPHLQADWCRMYNDGNYYVWEMSRERVWDVHQIVLDSEAYDLFWVESCALVGF